MKAGASEFLAKPWGAAEVWRAVDRALQGRRLMCEAPPGTLEGRGAGGRLTGRGRAMQEVYKQVGLVAEHDEPVLILGETGTGKELVARMIHQHSRRQGGPFLALNCAAVPEGLLENELFGHERGAFTGASRPHAGVFERACRGTLLLDEIADLPLRLQGKLLRVLQQGEVQRLGGREAIPVDVRILAATNQALEGAIRAGAFREDLYYRLRVVSLPVPPLRERREDIPELAEYFLARYTPPGAARPALEAAALQKLQAHAWPGNVRELENVIRQALVAAKGLAILAMDVLLGEPVQAAGAGPLGRCPDYQTVPAQGDSGRVGLPGSVPEQSLEEQLDLVLERWLAERVGDAPRPAGVPLADQVKGKLLKAALRVARGNQVQAARWLGISRSTLHQWMKRYGLHDHPDCS
jgi:DNA-binding NtrC family response regulator